MVAEVHLISRIYSLGSNRHFTLADDRHPALCVIIRFMERSWYIAV